MAQEIADRDDRYVMLFQYANEANPAAHYCGTAVEILERCRAVRDHDAVALRIRAFEPIEGGIDFTAVSVDDRDLERAGA